VWHIFLKSDSALFWLSLCKKASKYLLLSKLDGKTRCLFIWIRCGKSNSCLCYITSARQRPSPGLHIGPEGKRFWERSRSCDLVVLRCCNAERSTWCSTASHMSSAFLRRRWCHGRLNPVPVSQTSQNLSLAKSRHFLWLRSAEFCCHRRILYSTSTNLIKQTIALKSTQRVNTTAALPRLIIS